MSNLVYPVLPGLTWPVKKTPTFSTLVQRAPSGYETRIKQMNNPIWNWELEYAYIADDPQNIRAGFTDTDLRTLMGFYMARGGTFDDFLYQDPGDNSELGAPLQLLEDANATWYSPLQRSIGGTNGALEDITDLNTTGAGGFNPIVYANGTPVGASFTGPGLSLPAGTFQGLYIIWGGTAPTPPITCDFTWYFRVRFEKDDDFDLEWFTASPNRYKMKSVKLMTARPASLI
jgi:Conserved hypothetical protein 2217 (DUF2460)